LVDGAGRVFAEFVAGELETERTRRAALDQRGTTIVTSSGTLVTLLSALAAFAALREGNPKPGALTLVFFSLALVSFVVAAFYGLLANRSRGHVALAAASLDELRGDVPWNQPADDARRLLYGSQVETLQSLRSGNEEKSWLVNRGLLLQLAALFFLALTIFASIGDVLTR
jgi:hypothetical protein